MSTIKDLRIAAGLTAFELASKADVSISSINRIETGKQGVRRLVATKILNALNQALKRELTLDELEIKIVD